MPAAQRSILSFFQSSTSSALPASTPTRPIAAAPPPPPPPPQAKFVPPPSGNDLLRPLPPSGMTTRSGGSVDPKLDLPPITAELATAILTASGATASGDELVFPLPTSVSPVSASVRIAAPRDSHIPDLVSVNAILLSVRYPDAFYRPVADRTRVASLFNRVILDGEKVVGGIVCRLEPWPFGDDGLDPDPQPLVIYVQSLALLSPHRGRGLAAAALDSIAATAAALNATGRLPPVCALYAHTWTESTDVLRWYEARGFARHGAAPIENYYFALRPSTAWVLRRDLPLAPGPSSPPSAAASATAPATAPPRSAPTSSLSFQNARPDMEWNDLPADMMTVPSASASAASSRTVSRKTSRLNLPSSGLGEDDQTPVGRPTSSSRSSSAARKKRDRAYPAAMFGQ